MKRDLHKISEEKFDLLIIGGGIYGAALFWRTSLAGYSVALIEQNDFGSGTSSNSQKIIHGGLRYLQNLDLLRIRHSINERKRLFWLAPHLISPLPCIMPLYGHKTKGKEVLKIAVKLYDLISADRNNIPDKSKHIPDGKTLSKKKINELLPGIEQKGLNGGVLWYDAFCNNTERLIISFIKSGVNFGSSCANYLKAEKLIIENNTAKGALVTDKLSGNQFSISAEKVIDCTGPSQNEFSRCYEIPKLKYVAGLNIVIKRLFSHNFAVGVENKIHNRLYFAAPWNDKTILGTDWYPAPEPEKFEFKKIHVRKLIENFNETYPSLNLKLDDVEFVLKGFVPASNNLQDSNSILPHFRIVNTENNGLKSFYKIIGVKYTTAVNVAESFLKTCTAGFKKLSLKEQPKLVGGEIDNTIEFREQIENNFKNRFTKYDLDRLINNYGSEIFKIIGQGFDIQPDDHYSILKSEIIYAIRDEMALHLDDVVFRRTDLGSSGIPSETDLEIASNIMSEELNWTETETIEEISRVEKYYSIINKNQVFKQNVVLK